MELNNKVSIVTASTKGIGLAISLKLASCGAKVYLAARNEKLAQEIIEKHKDLQLSFVYFDASNNESLSKMIDEVYEKEQRIDILVNNFGGSDPSKDRTIFDTDPNYFDEVLLKNINSVFIPTQKVLKIMMKQNSGSIINISSIGSVVPDISRIGYVTSKAVINTLTKNIALQVGKYNIRCNAILPGMIDTPAVSNNIDQTFIDAFKKCVPLNKIGEPDDIANLACFLASDKSKYITSQIIEVAGGFGNTTSLFPLFNKKSE